MKMTPQQRVAAAQQMDARRAEVRRTNPADWPYAYNKPVSEGGSCLECGATSGGHHYWCEAVS